MRTTQLVLGVSVAVAVGACAGTTHRPARTSVNAGAPANLADLRATAESTEDSSHWTAPEPEPAPRERPGLATQWGETRESHVHDVDFLRSDPERPFAFAQIFYNDGAGVRALAAYHGGTLRPLSLGIASGAITVSLRDARGNPFPGMRAGDRTYVSGQEGERYTIAIANATPRRFEAVATVDGLDVISGQPGSVGNRGYVLMPWQSLEIDGFRQSEEAVAAFRFSKVNDSYAAQRGDARNVGVIGVAFYAERGDDWSHEELRTRDSANPFPSDGRFAPSPW